MCACLSSMRTFELRDYCCCVKEIFIYFVMIVVVVVITDAAAAALSVDVAVVAIYIIVDAVEYKSRKSLNFIENLTDSNPNTHTLSASILKNLRPSTIAGLY